MRKKRKSNKNLKKRGNVNYQRKKTKPKFLMTFMMTIIQNRILNYLKIVRKY